MAGGLGIEPGSPALQAGADVTRLAHHRLCFYLDAVLRLHPFVIFARYFLNDILRLVS